METSTAVTGNAQIRTAIIVAVLVVLLSAVLLFGLSVIGKEQPLDKPPATGAPIVFPTTVQRQ